MTTAKTTVVEITRLKDRNVWLEEQRQEYMARYNKDQTTIKELKEENRELRNSSFSQRAEIVNLETAVARFSGYIDRIKECEQSADLKISPPAANFSNGDSVQPTPQGYNSNFNGRRSW